MSVQLFVGKIHVVAQGNLLIGGHTTASHGFDATTALRDGNPIIPASSLKGALREAVYRRAQSEGQEVCEPWDSYEDRKDACVKSPCVLCRIFGSPGPNQPQVLTDESASPAAGWMRTGLRLSDAQTQQHIPTAGRHGVAVDRWAGHAVDHRLYHREVAEVNDSAVFEAEFRARLTSDDLDYLRLAARLVAGIGNSQSRGLGRIQVSVSQLKGSTRSASRTLKLMSPSFAAGCGVLNITAREPLHLGSVPRPGSFRNTLHFVPGSTAHGALVAAAARTGLFSPEELTALAEGLSFSDLYPAEEDSGTLPFPAPRTVLQCSYCSDPSDRFNLAISESIARYFSLQGTPLVMDLPRCPRCNAEPKPMRGLVGARAAKTRLITRLARDPVSQSYAYGLLYAREQIEAETQFRGTVSGLQESVVQLLARLEESGEPIYVGSMRNRGLGKSEFTFASLSNTVRDRVKQFQTSESVQAASKILPSWDPASLVFVSARTPVPSEPGQNPARWVGASLFGGNVEVLGAWQREGHRSGWNDRKGTPRPVLSVLREGSCWLFQTRRPLDWARLHQAETTGIGDFKHCQLGLGRVHICPPLHLGE